MAGEKSTNIRGITIKLGGDASPLVQAFKDVDKAVKSTTTSLKDIDKLLKVDPGNVTLLKQKQDLLNRSLEETAEKLEAAKKLRDHLLSDNVDNKNQRQIENLNREIVELEQHLDEVRKKSDSFNVLGEQIKAAGNSIKSLGDKVTRVGTALSTHVTAPLAALGTATMAAWKQVDSALDTVRSKTGATGEAMEELEAIVKDIATTIPASFDEAGIAVGEVNTRFGVTGDKLKELSTQFIKFAQINGVDLNDSIDSVQKSMDAFGLSADQAGEFLDYLNKVGQDTGVNVGSLTKTLTTNATALRSMGMGAADAIKLLGDLEKSGVDASLVMQGFSKVQKEALDSGVSMQEAFRKALSSSENAINIFGAKAGPKLYEAFNNGTLSVDMFTGGVASLDDALGNLDRTFEEVKDPSDDLQMAMNELMIVGHDLGEVIQKELAPIIVEITKALREFKDWFVSLDEETKQTIIRCTAIIGAVGPVLVVIGSVISAVGSVVHGIGTLVGLGGKVVGFFAGMGGAASAAQGAAAGVGTAMTTSAAATTAAAGSMTAATTAASGGYLAAAAAATGLGGAVVLAAGSVAAAAVAIYQNWNDLGEMFQTVGQLINANINMSINVIKMMAAQAKVSFTNFANSAKESAGNGMAALKAQVQIGLVQAKALFDTFGTNVRNTIQTTMSNIQSRTSGAMTAVRTVIQTGMAGAQSAVSSAMSGMRSTIDGAWSNIRSITESTTGTIKSNVSGAWNSISESIRGHVTTIKNNITSTFNSAMETAGSKMSSLKSDAASTWSGIVSTISTAVNNIKNAIANTTLKFGSVTIPTFEWVGKNDSTKGTTANIDVGSKTVKYASAMFGGAILKGATIFGAMGDKILQAGEVGSEVVVGTNSLMNMIARTARANSNNATLIAGVGAIYSLLTQYLPEAAADKNVVLDSGRLVGALTPAINRQLGLMMG